jgi:uncharacterized membrane protein
MVTVAADILTVGDPARALAVLGLLLVAPGAGWVWALRISDPVARLALVVALSMALDALVAILMAYTGTWSPVFGAAILGVVTTAGVLVGARVDRVTRPEQAGSW